MDIPDEFKPKTPEELGITPEMREAALAELRAKGRQVPEPKPKVERTGAKYETGIGINRKPEVIGQFKHKPKSLLDWSIDELIEYKALGVHPKRVVNADALYMLGRAGVSLKTCADVFQCSIEFIVRDEHLHGAWSNGRAEIAGRVRSLIVEEAVENKNLQAQIYLDKLLSGESVKQQLDISVSSSGQLEQISTEELLEVGFTEVDDDNSQENQDQ